LKLSNIKVLLFVLGVGIIIFLLASSSNSKIGYTIQKPVVVPEIMNVQNTKYVPDPRHLKSTKWNYLYSFAILTQREWFAEYLADNVLYSCELNRVDSYVVGRKIWKETHFQAIKVSYLSRFRRDSTGNYIVTNGTNILESYACAYGVMMVNLDIHKKRLWDYNKGALRPYLNCEQDYIREILKVPVNTDIGTSIFRGYLDMFDDRIDYALCAYWSGENSSYLKQLKNGIGNEYVTWIMDEEKALGEMTMYDFVNPETMQTNKWKYIPKRNELFFETNSLVNK
jgi:hypothetical protein